MLAGNKPRATHTVARVVKQVRMARNTYWMRLECPEIAETIVPGQFFMLRQPGTTEPLLGRPFALLDVHEDAQGRKTGVELGYLTVGKLTRRMTTWRPDDRAEVWGPLGNGFPVPNVSHLVMVAGGIGQTPFPAVAREALGLRTYGQPPRQVLRRPDRLTLCYGVRSAEYLAGLEYFDLPGLDVRVSTDDGSRGYRGFVSDLLRDSIEQNGPPDAIYCCGPERMMHAVSAIAQSRNIPCWLSLESPMACGFGVCFSCVAKVRTEDGSWDYRRACVDGPVFRADQLIL
jgi:dihydroorotate dehydrogenase electron transfer subunit